MKSKTSKVYVVYAEWCPHCVPTTVGPLERKAKELKIPVVLLDIDSEDEAKADDLVKNYGDWTPDYLIPQVFVEKEDGKVEHVLTGDPRGLRYTQEVVEKMLKALG